MNFTDSPYEKMMKQVPRPPRSEYIRKKQPSDRRNKRRKPAARAERPDNG